MSSQSNRRRLGKGEALDHISNLPDALICCILSFIPTKCAVRTSILSERWKNIWTKVPTIDLTCMPILLRGKTKQNFNRFVDNVLLQNDVSDLHHLRFYIPAEGHDDINVKSWLNLITRREIIREIEILLGWPRRPDPVPLPKTFFFRERLEVLKLNGNFTIDTPKSLHLPYLETIHLDGVHFRDDEFIKKLLASCHLLKSLHIVRCTGITSSLHIESPTLKTLEIAIFISDYDYEASVPLGCHVIKAPNLRYLHLGEPPTQYDICDLSSLVEADLSLCSLYDTQRAFELVRNFSAVTTLRLGTCRLFRFLNEPPIFSNLSYLELGAVNEGAYNILNSAPKLRSLIIGVVWCWDPSFETMPEPQCMSSIESIELRLIRGRKDMRLIAYLLKAASALKEMRITIADFLNKPDYAVLLLSLPKACVACQVIIK